MRNLLLWALAGGGNLLLLWQLGAGQPWIAPLLACALAVMFNLALGIGLGHTFAQAYLDDMTRLNRSLVDQNSELVQCNRELLSRLDRTHAEPLAHLREGQSA